MLFKATLLAALFLAPAFAVDVDVQLCDGGCENCGDVVSMDHLYPACLNSPDLKTHAFLKPQEDIAGADRWCTIWSD